MNTPERDNKSPSPSERLGEVQELYLNKIQQLAMFLNPWELTLLLGRGTGKSAVHAFRVHEVVTHMPRCTFGLVGPTYINLMERTIPPMRRYLQEHYGWIEDIHYVMFRRPPDDWAKPYIPLDEHKHAISFYNGTVGVLGSLDRAGILNSLSLQYYGIDEARFSEYERITKDLMPAVRGELKQFQHCHLLYGRTITSDLPYMEDGAEWLYKIESRMNKEQINLIFHLAYKVNYLARKMIAAGTDVKAIDKIKHEMCEWQKMLNAARKHSTFFAITSSLINIDVLGIDYFLHNSDPEINPKHIFRTSFLSIKPLSVEDMFYGQLKQKHFYRATYNYEYIDAFYSEQNSFPPSGGQRGVKKTTCLRDTDIISDMPLYAGLDFGNMNSLVIAQRTHALSFEEGMGEVKIVKEFYVLSPDILDDLANAFCDYYEPHRKKVLYLYYDRSGNNRMANSRNTYAEHFQSALRSRGWIVQLMSMTQGNIPHDTKWLLVNDMLSENDTKRYPVIRINEDNCKCLKSSLNMAPTEKYKGTIRKVKKSEKLPLQRLPMESTNMSDAFDYLIWGEFRQQLKRSGSVSGITIGNTTIG
jgi:hypothetical protein